MTQNPNAVAKYSAQEIKAGALVPLTPAERYAAAIAFTRSSDRLTTQLFWFVALVSIAGGYLWKNWWHAAAICVAAVVLLGIQDGCRTWSIITMHRRTGWFALNSFCYALSTFLLVAGTLFVIVGGIWHRWL